MTRVSLEKCHVNTTRVSLCCVNRPQKLKSNAWRSISVRTFCSVDALGKDCKAKEDKISKLKQVAIRAKKELENSKKQAAVECEQLNAVIKDMKEEAETRSHSLQLETQGRAQEYEVGRQQ